MHELDIEMRELNFVGKTFKQQQEEKLENFRTKIEICHFKQKETIEETKSTQKELNIEKRKFRVLEE